MNKNVAVFGAGLSGESVANLAKSEGNSVTIFDEKVGTNNHFLESDIISFDNFIFSPGFPKDHPWRVLLSGYKSIYGELGYAAERWRGKIYGVTGTNGKTTVTRLLQSILRRSGKEAYIAGNIGFPLSKLVISGANHKDAIAVCEISSFQAEIIKGLSLDGLIWTNFSEDHMDRYDSIEEYFESKFKLFSILKKSATVCVSEQLLKSKEVSFWISRGAKIVKVDKDLPKVIKKTSVFQLYPHIYNYHLVCGFIKELNINVEDSALVANDFVLDAHRLRKIFDHERLKIWEDSKATNLDSVLGALKSMEGPVIWIGGGMSKNSDFANFANILSPLVDWVILYGLAGRVLNEEFVKIGKKSTYYPKLDQAIRAGYKLSRKQNGVNILFSPGFASFDQFNSYADRGKFFQKTIFSLLNEQGCL